MKFSDIDENGEPVVEEASLDTNNNGLDDKVETEVFHKSHSRKYTLAWYCSIVLTLLLCYSCYKGWVDLVPAVCGWLVGVVCGYSGIEVADKGIQKGSFHRRDN